MELAIQFDLLAQGSNFEDWGDLLVIVIMAILWLVGGLAKVITSRKGGAAQQQQREGSAKQPARQRETWQERLARKAEEMQRAAEARGRQPEQETRARTQTAQPSPHAGGVTVRTDQKGDSVLVYERPAGQTGTQRTREAGRAVLPVAYQAAKSPSIEARVETGGLAYEPILDSAVARSETLPEPAAGFLPAAIIDYSDPDALQKAILHYEILGKPLALREPSDEAISF